MLLRNLLLILFSILNTTDLSKLLEQNIHLSFDKRIEVMSEYLLDTPFKESSIGEGYGVDMDPVVNLNYTDCVTFVEYVIAFANSVSLEEFERNVRFMRYGDREIAFENRMHLPDNQWFPNLTNYGYITDITKRVGRKYVTSVKKTITKDHFQIDGKIITSEKLFSRSVSIDYIPTQDISKILNNIPPLSIIRILREDSYRPYLTTHIGIVIKKDNKLYLRHSSRHFGKKVVDTPLSTYFATFESYENWKALGIAIYKINDIRKKDAE